MNKRKKVLKLKDFSKPEKSDLRKGNVLPIYGNFTEEKDFRGNAVLIERRPSKWRNEKSGFIRAIIGDDSQDFEGYGELWKTKGYGVLWKSQRWVIKYVDGPYEGFTTCANIGYFYDYSFIDWKNEEEE